MKVAISSASCAASLAAGGLTQLEWLERSAGALGADGIVFDDAHFPRTDREYVAQLRKVAVDVGLVPVALDAPLLFAPDGDEPARADALELAAGLGALFVLTRLPPKGDVPPATFIAAVGAAKAAVRLAKAVNITLLVLPAPGSLAENVLELRHFLKDVDSAWLRYGLPAGAGRSALRARDRVLLVTVDASAALDEVAEIDEAGRPWLLLEGDVSPQRVVELRRAAAKKTLATAGVS
jgi:hypothetical protein